MKPWTPLVCCTLLAAVSLTAAESAPAPAPAAVPLPSSKSGPAVPGYLRTGFDILGAFPFNPPEPDPSAKPGTPPPSAANQIPPAIKALDGKKVIVTGYMLPVKMDKGLVTEFLLVSSPSACCYGVTPQMNEFIVVKMPKGVKSFMDAPVEFYGTLAVKEVIEEGYLANIYTLDGEKMGKAGVD